MNRPRSIIFEALLVVALLVFVNLTPANAFITRIHIEEGNVLMLESGNIEILSSSTNISMDHYEVEGSVNSRYATVECKLRLINHDPNVRNMILGISGEKYPGPHSEYSPSRISDVDIEIDDEKVGVHNYAELVEQHFGSQKFETYIVEYYIPWYYFAAYMPLGNEITIEIKYRHKLSFYNGGGIYRFYYPIEWLNEFQTSEDAFNITVSYPNRNEMKKRLKSAEPDGYIHDDNELEWDFASSTEATRIMVTERVLLKH